MYNCKYFGIKELVSPIVYEKWGGQAWIFFNADVLKELDLIRELWGSSIIINNWASGGTLKQCGLRSNLDQMVKDKTKANALYLSAHTMGCGFDLHDALGRNSKLHSFVHNLIAQKKLKCFKRLENYSNTNGWVHCDCFQSHTDSVEIF